jgi:Trk K+ transport system NAD-binding subunit
MKNLRRQLRYLFDNSLSRKGAFPLWMVAIFLAAIIILTILRAVLTSIPALDIEPSADAQWFEAFWYNAGKALSIGASVTIAERIMALLYWFIGLAAMGSIFAFRTMAMNATLERMKAAPSPILDKGHTLILGWSPRVFTILKELAIAAANERNPVVVVFADVDRATMDMEISKRAGDLGKLRLITRKGDTTSPVDLKRANVSGAKTVIVLDSERTGDSTIVSTVLAARSVSNDPHQRFIAEVDDPNIAEALEDATDNQVVTVIPRAVIAKVTAQASRQPGIPAVILELLDFAGDEIYFTSIPELEGKTYFQAQLSFTKSAIMGVVPSGQGPILNPAQNYKLKAGDQIIAISADDDQVTYSGSSSIKRPKASDHSRTAPRARNLLVIGWSAMGKSMLTELAEFLPRGSVADVVSQPRFIEETLVQETKFGHLKVNHIQSTGEFVQLQQLVAKKKYDEVIILGYRGEKVTESEADGQTLLTSMQLSRLFQVEMAEGTAPRLVAEILDPLKVPLAQTSSLDDLVVSENLAALLVAQLSQNPQLASIFKDLFNPTAGSAIHVRTMGDYAKLGQRLTFADLVAAASSHGETAIGWRVRGDDGQHAVAINPSKDAELTPVETDGLIVIGKSI